MEDTAHLHVLERQNQPLKERSVGGESELQGRRYAASEIKMMPNYVDPYKHQKKYILERMKRDEAFREKRNAAKREKRKRDREAREKDIKRRAGL